MNYVNPIASKVTTNQHFESKSAIGIKPEELKLPILEDSNYKSEKVQPRIDEKLEEENGNLTDVAKDKKGSTKALANKFDEEIDFEEEEIPYSVSLLPYML